MASVNYFFWFYKEGLLEEPSCYYWVQQVDMLPQFIYAKTF